LADLDPVVSATLRRLEPGLKEHQSRLRDYDNAYDIWRASAPVRGVAPWQSKLRVKYAMQVIDTALVNIVSGNPRIMVKPRRPQDVMNAKKMQNLLDYFVKEDHLVEKQPVFVQQGLIYGVSPAKVHWLYKEAMRPVKEYAHNPLDPTTPYESVSMQRLIVQDGPTFSPWPVDKCYWDPGAYDVDSAAYVVLQDYISKDDLQQLAFNGDSGTGIYHNVDQLLAAGSAPQPHQTSQERANGGEQNRYKDKFLIEEIWTDDELLVIGNRQVLLRRQPNPYWHGRKPIVIAQTRPDLFEMVGVPTTELMDHIQQALWTVQNMRMDNLHLTVQRGITYREGGVTDPNMLELRPRFKWPVSDHDDIRPFEVQPLPPEAYNEENALLARGQLVTGINPYISGSDLNTVDQNTATGVTALQEVASRLLRFQASMIQNKGYQRAFEMWGDMAQQFHDKTVDVEIIGPDGKAAWDSISPQEIIGHYQYVIEGSEESLSRQQERGEAVALLNAFAPLLANRPDINIRPILERVATAYDFPNPESLFAPPQPQVPPAPMSPDQFNPNVLGPRINPGQTGMNNVQMDPRLANALAVNGQTFNQR
jgi:hypothetical protein